jgi:hypothetical protein
VVVAVGKCTIVPHTTHKVQEINTSHLTAQYPLIKRLTQSPPISPSVILTNYLRCWEQTNQLATPVPIPRACWKTMHESLELPLETPSSSSVRRNLKRLFCVAYHTTNYIWHRSLAGLLFWQLPMGLLFQEFFLQKIRLAS